MGMPIITSGTGTRDQAVTDLLESVALQETALSHILNAEGEKMQAIIAMPGLTADKLLELNDSVNKMINAVTRLEMMFQSKLELFSGNNSAPLVGAALELSKINVPSVSIGVPLTDPTAQTAAAALVNAAAQLQVAPGYTVNFVPTSLNPATGAMTGSYTVTSTTNPADTTTGPITTVNVLSTAPPATGAALQLSNINVPSVSIAVPLTDPTAPTAAAALVNAAAQLQVAPGYTVNFVPTGLNPATGAMTGNYTVTSTTNPADTATGPITTVTVLSTAPPATGAALQLSNINVPSVSIAVPLTDATAQTAAATLVNAAAQLQVAPGYTVNFVPTSLNPTTGVMTGTYTVTSTTNPADTATGPITTVNVLSTGTPPPIAGAPLQLGMINVPSVSIGVPLTDPTAQTTAVSLINSAAQAQVTPGYTVSYVPTNFNPITGIMTGAYTVTSTTNPADTVTGPTFSTVTVVSTIPLTGAPLELSKINIPSVAINVPLTDPTAETAAVNQVNTAAQLLVSPDYTVTFVPTAYDPATGLLTGSYTVTSITNPADTITSPVTTIRTFSTVTTAAAELQRINVNPITISVPLSSADAQAISIQKAVTQAQSQVAPGYTVTFVNGTYNYTGTSPATLTGSFTVTNTTTNDTATDATPRTIDVLSQPANASSSATSQLLSGSLAGLNLDTIPLLAPAHAEYTNGVTPGTSVISTATINTSALAGNLINLAGTSFDLGNFLQLGAANQYAEAMIDGASRAYAGAVSNNGVVSINGSPAFPSNATLDLGQLLPIKTLISDAKLTVGAITGEAYWDASTPNSLVRSYDIASLTLDVVSPAIAGLVQQINAVLGTFQTSINGLGNTILNTITSTLNTLGALTAVIPGMTVRVDNLVANVNLSITNALAPILAQPLALSDGSITIDLNTGTVHIDLTKFWGGTINNFPPNTPLLTTALLKKLEDGKTGILIDLTTALTNLLTNLANSAAVTISGGVSLMVLGTPQATLNITYSGTLLQLVNGTNPIVITAGGTLGTLVNPILGTVVSTVQTAIGGTLNTLIFDPNTGLVNTAWILANDAVTAVLTVTAPIFTTIAAVISININVQTNGANVFTEIPIQFSLLSTAGATIDLNKVIVGPNYYTIV